MRYDIFRKHKNLKLMIKRILIYLFNVWEFIQNYIGQCEVKKYNLIPSHYFKDCYIYYISYFDSHCYGKHIFINQDTDNNIILRHEYGHRIQSKILGIMYYPLIFLPSYLHFLFWCKFKNNNWDKYYNFYSEIWADKLSRKRNIKERRKDRI